MDLQNIRSLRKKGLHTEALTRLQLMLKEAPNNSMAAYEAASVLDFMGRENEAIPLYQIAISGGLPPEQEQDAYLGLGSSLRAVGDSIAATAVFEKAITKYPNSVDLGAFYALALYSSGRGKESVEFLLALLASQDGRVTRINYINALKAYSLDIDRLQV